MMPSSLMYVLLVAVCIATIATAAPSIQNKATRNQLKETIKDHLKEGTLENKVVHIQRREPNTNPPQNPPCNSSKTNDTIPSAYISGHLSAWSATTDDYYITHWMCDDNDGFVEGGMMFDRVENKLHVPECGYYYISSQVNFHQGTRTPRPTSEPSYAFHQLIAEPNCYEDDLRIQTRAYATKPTANFWITNTNTGRIFKLCTGGKVYVRIPFLASNVCCPFGRYSFISAHLVQRTPCPSN